MQLGAKEFLGLSVAAVVTHVSRTAFGWWLGSVLPPSEHQCGTVTELAGVKQSTQTLSFLDVRISSVLYLYVV